LDITFLLCDAADDTGGKLNILGGGWSQVGADLPFNMALAILATVPWDQTNKQFIIEAKLMTEDGEIVELDERGPVVANGQLEVGRPPGMKPGTSINVPMALKFSGVVLPAGGYRWEIDVDGTQMATAVFRAVQR
jgi:hypothetical protein